MTDTAAGFPFAEFAVPGPRRRAPAAAPAPGRRDGRAARAPVPRRRRQRRRLAERSPGSSRWRSTRGESDTAAGTDFSVELRGFQDFTLLIAKRDPGQGLVWLAAGCLIVGPADHVLDAASPGVGPGRDATGGSR